MEPDFLSKTTHEQQEYLLSNLKDWSILNGLAVRPSAYLFPAGTDLSGALATTAPVTLYPSLFPRACFDEARAIQKAYNELYAAIARDREWLKHIVERYVWALFITFHLHTFILHLALSLPINFSILSSCAMVEHSRSIQPHPPNTIATD